MIEWEIRALTGSLVVRSPDGRERFTTGGYVLIDPAYVEMPIGPFRTIKQATRYRDRRCPCVGGERVDKSST